jgi:pimeloyl-ACP methyl ester carboxylesterase
LTRSGYQTASICLAACVAAITCACGGDGGGRDRAERPPARVTAAPTIAPQPLDQCPSAGRGWQPLSAGSDGPLAARLGSGRLGVVFVDDSTDDPCAWSKQARDLAARGYAVAVFKSGGGTERKQALAVAAALRRSGARRIALIGASVGARAALQAAASHPPGVDGVVSLSAERRVRTDLTDLLPVAKRVRLPVLSVGARDDALTRFGRDTRAFARALSHDRLLLVSGPDHGVELLDGKHGRRVRAAITRFLRLL